MVIENLQKCNVNLYNSNYNFNARGFYIARSNSMSACHPARTVFRMAVRSAVKFLPIISRKIHGYIGRKYKLSILCAKFLSFSVNLATQSLLRRNRYLHNESLYEQRT